ncbi:DUF2007 domain-containing protein [Maribellus luteus]|uniref:DUF2007 domain-containing protein n=1 Tax=Maribellus luteus TaxID=2305463 RepID=A0A399T8A7_9BACT|nr:DUF2007 domain-containing protein [Maribellus luteus]RIJ50437.1 DUF2007 domain-containing protein [Maribellus luteus]
MEDKIVKLYTSSDVIISHIKQELESKDIFCLIKDGFGQGINAGFVGGVSSAIDLFVRESDLDEAIEIVKAITEV